MHGKVISHSGHEALFPMHQLVTYYAAYSVSNVRKNNRRNQRVVNAKYDGEKQIREHGNNDPIAARIKA